MGRPDLWHRNVIELAVADGRFSAFLRAIQHAGLSELLTGPGPFILFAPVDTAFVSISQGLLQRLRLAPEALSRLVSCHVVRGAMEISRLTDPCHLRSLAGKRLTVIPGRILRVEDARILADDLVSRNGCLVPINRLLLPKDPPEPGT